MEIPRDGRRFLLADTGICVSPSLARRIDILRERGRGRACPRGADSPRSR